MNRDHNFLPDLLSLFQLLPAQVVQFGDTMIRATVTGSSELSTILIDYGDETTPESFVIGQADNTKFRLIRYEYELYNLLAA